MTIIAAMHGDEVYGIELYDHFTKKYPSLSSSVQLIIGNKLAYEKNVRFIDADMNRQYGSRYRTHEQCEVTRVDSQIKKFNPKYIIDVHTTRRNSGIFFISDSPNKKRQRIYDMLDIDICIMKDRVIKTSLIGNYSNAVSLEYSIRSITLRKTQQFIDALAGLVQGSKQEIDNNRIYYAKKLISKDEWQNHKELKNYDKTPEGIALMVPADTSEMDAEYFGFWCSRR